MKRIILAAIALSACAAAPPAERGVIPSEAWAYLVARPADLFGGEAGARLKRADRRPYPLVELLDEMAEHLTGGVLPTEIERVGVFLLAEDFCWSITRDRPIDVPAFLRAMKAASPAETPDGRRPYALPDGQSVVFLGGRTALVGPARAIDWCLAARSAVAVPPGQQLVASFSGPRMRATLKKVPPGAGPPPDLLQHLESAEVSIRLGERLELKGRAAFSDSKRADEARRALMKAHDDALPTMPEVGQIMAELALPATGVGTARDILAFYTAAHEELRRLAIEQRGAELSVSLRMPGRGAAAALASMGIPRAIFTPLPAVPAGQPIQSPAAKE